jgi:aryl-alcohol dehydrogenase-like predicted oxidoreductase
MIQLDARYLGASGIAVPPLGIGVWSWGDKGFWGYGTNYSRQDISEAYAVCIDAGLNFFDTAELYGNGASERILGECVRSDERPVVIASKFAPFPTRLSARKLLDALDHSLERLGVQSIDLYQVHWPNPLLKINDLMDAMAEAVHAGKIRAVGVSNYSVDAMRQAHARLARHGIPLASNQVHYSILHRQPETSGVLDACRDLNIALIAYSPLEQGILTGKYRPGPNRAKLPPLARRVAGNVRAARLNTLEPLFQTMEKIAQTHEKTIGQVALNWLLSKDELIIPIPGAKNARQARENAGAVGWQLDAAEIEQIAQVAGF